MPRILLIISSCVLFLIVLVLANAPNPDTIKLGGGPEGGTFIIFAKGIAALLEQQDPELKIAVLSSGGSVANLKSVDTGKVAMALAYAGDAYLGRQGGLSKETTRMTNVRALGRIYGSTAQLAVLQDSVIQTPYDLVYRRVAIGSSGSGAAHSAERYFRSIGIWDHITPLYIGYALGMIELSSGRAEAVWQLVGAPSSSISELNRKTPLRLIELSRAARSSDFFAENPYYTETEIPANTYRGQHRAVETFQDNTLLVTYINADKELLKKTLRLLYSPAGIAALRKRHPIAKDLDVNKGLQGIIIPLHPVAEEFWRKAGQL